VLHDGAPSWAVAHKPSAVPPISHNSAMTTAALHPAAASSMAANHNKPLAAAHATILRHGKSASTRGHRH
jgi:hypothetical protein